MSSFRRGSVEVQRFLVPELVEVSRADLELDQDWRLAPVLEEVRPDEELASDGGWDDWGDLVRRPGRFAELERCRAFGIPWLVTHPGNFMDDRDAGLARNAEAYALAGFILLDDKGEATAAELPPAFAGIAIYDDLAGAAEALIAEVS